jgi:hypothetical protein
LAAETETPALNVLLEEVQRYRRALLWYADRNNYMDGVPYLKDTESGLFGEEDNGAMARNALRRVDVALGVVLPMPLQQERSAA